MKKTSHTSNSPYHDLYRSIEKMRRHGMQNNDSHMVQLATALVKNLTNFESHPNKKNSAIKNNFRVQFLATLHREDKSFHNQPNPTKPFLGAIYKALYISVFEVQKMNSLSFFQASADKGVEPKKDFRP